MMRFGTIDAPEPGLHFDVPDGVYRQWDAIPWSLLKRMKVSPGCFKWHVEHPDYDEDTDALQEGRLFDVALLQPDLLSQKFTVRPATYPAPKSAKKGAETIEKPWRMNAKYCKEWVGLQESHGLEVVKAEQVAQAGLQVAKIREIPQVMQILDGADFQVSVVWRDEQTGLLCKGRMDVLKRGQEADAKRTQRLADHDGWLRTMQRYGYFGQAAYYRDGHDAVADRPEVPIFRFLVSEGFPPYRGTYYDMIDVPEAASQILFTEGRHQYHSYLQQVERCIKDDDWPDWSPPSDDELQPGLAEWLRLDCMIGIER